MRHLLMPGTILCLPTTPFPAPKRGEPLSAASAQHDRILCLCAHGGLTGVPQVSIPGAEVDGPPVGPVDRRQPRQRRDAGRRAGRPDDNLITVPARPGTKIAECRQPALSTEGK
jgi:hypothetical protein